MQQYLLSVYQPDGDPPPPEQLDAIMARVLAWEGELKAAGSWVFTGGLREASAATVLRARGQGVLVTDGPFTEGKEHLGGFTVISVPGADAAREWGSRLAAATGLPIEVRQMRAGDDQVTAREAAARGMTVRREVLGDEHVDRATAGTTGFTAPLQDLITRYAWGEVWSRPGLARAERSMITLAMLAALGREHELALHVRGAVRNGLTEAQISEVLLQVAVYAGVPAANRAFAVAQDVLDQLDAPPGRR